MALALRITNSEGDMLANQCLPADDGARPGLVSVLSQVPSP